MAHDTTTNSSSHDRGSIQTMTVKDWREGLTFEEIEDRIRSCNTLTHGDRMRQLERTTEEWKMMDDLCQDLVTLSVSLCDQISEISVMDLTPLFQPENEEMKKKQNTKKRRTKQSDDSPTHSRLMRTPKKQGCPPKNSLIVRRVQTPNLTSHAHRKKISARKRVGLEPEPWQIPLMRSEKKKKKRMRNEMKKAKKQERRLQAAAAAYRRRRRQNEKNRPPKNETHKASDDCDTDSQTDELDRLDRELLKLQMKEKEAMQIRRELMTEKEEYERLLKPKVRQEILMKYQKSKHERDKFDTDRRKFASQVRCAFSRFSELWKKRHDLQISEECEKVLTALVMERRSIQNGNSSDIVKKAAVDLIDRRTTYFDSEVRSHVEYLINQVEPAE